MVYGGCSSESGQSLVVEVVVEGWLNGGDGARVFRPKTLENTPREVYTRV